MSAPIKSVCVCVGIDEAYILFEVERIVNRQVEGIKMVYYIRLFLINRLSQQTDINCKGT